MPRRTPPYEYRFELTEGNTPGWVQIVFAAVDGNPASRMIGLDTNLPMPYWTEIEKAGATAFSASVKISFDLPLDEEEKNFTVDLLRAFSFASACQFRGKTNEATFLMGMNRRVGAPPQALGRNLLVAVDIAAQERQGATIEVGMEQTSLRYALEDGLCVQTWRDWKVPARRFITELLKFEDVTSEEFNLALSDYRAGLHRFLSHHIKRAEVLGKTADELAAWATKAR